MQIGVVLAVVNNTLFQRKHKTSMNQSTFEFVRKATEAQGKGFNFFFTKGTLDWLSFRSSY